MLILDNLRLVQTQTGERHTAIYLKIKDGLFPRPVKVGRSSRWPRHVIQAIVLARIAGKSDEEIKLLVDELHARRTAVAAVAA